MTAISKRGGGRGGARAGAGRKPGIWSAISGQELLSEVHVTASPALVEELFSKAARGDIKALRRIMRVFTTARRAIIARRPSRTAPARTVSAPSPHADDLFARSSESERAR